MTATALPRASRESAHGASLVGWAAIALIVLGALSQGMPEGIQAAAAGVRDLGFAGMSVSLLRGGTRGTTIAGPVTRYFV